MLRVIFSFIVVTMIVLKNVSKTFDTGRQGQVDALVNVSLEIFDGEFVSLIGPSGCGKSTILRLIGDLVVPTNGVIHIGGKTPLQVRSSRQYGMVFQQPTLYDWRTVRKNVELPLEIIRFSKADRESQATKMLELVQLVEFQHHYPWQLSGGMQQRVAIARALAVAPNLLMMDEPFGALDEMTREHMQLELLAIHSRTKTTVVFVTHSISEAVLLSNRVVVLSARPGQIVGIVPIDLPYPRNRATLENPQFFAALTAVRKMLHGNLNLSD